MHCKIEHIASFPQDILEKSLHDYTEELQKNPNRQVWVQLAKVSLTRITIFNKRRGEEPSKMLLSTFSQRKLGEHNQEILQTLNAIERKLLTK